LKLADPALGALLPKVKQAAVDACACLHSGEDLKIRNKGSNDFITRIDLEVSEYLCRELPRIFPAPVLSEENKTLPSAASCLWIIDPIDGTNNLIYDLPFYAVSIGLVREQQGILGTVYIPATGELFSAARGCGAFVENLRIPGVPVKPARVSEVDSLSRAIVMAETDPYFDREKNPSMDLIKAVYRRCIDCRITGSAAVDLSYIAAGRAHVHFCRHLNPWDYAGGTVILTEAGGIVSQWDGSPMAFEGKHTSLACSSRAIHEEMLALVGRFL
jgi:myo-inositol-1(or 4)-monophosphatase